jgi:molybdopterin-guanine dinucleotide biosynthesis protein A
MMRGTTDAIVLAGGRSSRLASAGLVPAGGKAALRLSGRTLLERVCTRVAGVAGRIIVVAAPGQGLEEPPTGVEIVHDSAPGSGPLAGIADGLRTLGGASGTVLIVTCDVPLVSPALLTLLGERLEGATVRAERSAGVDRSEPLWVVPEVEGHLQVLLSAVRPAVLPAIEAHLAGGRRDPRSLVERLIAGGMALVVPEAIVRPIDPGLWSFRDLDTPRDLEELGQRLALQGER